MKKEFLAALGSLHFSAGLFPLAAAAMSSAGVASASGAPDAGNEEGIEHDERPNIIFFLVDDMGWQDTSVPFWTQKTRFNELYETPNMERLAERSVLFTQAYASSVSSPSRCSMMTGANAARHRVTNWTLRRDVPPDKPSDVLELPAWNWNGISQAAGVPHTFLAKSFVQYLHDSGYHTIHCGKAHWGAIDTPGENPCHFGFDVNIAGHAAGGLATYLSEARYGHDENGNPVSLMAVPGLEKYWNTGTFITEALTQEALAALDKAKAYGQPFYLYMSHYAIHVPIDKDMRFFGKYKAKGMSDREAAYASLIEGMDKSLGDIMDWLEENGEADNTVIIFMGDNGGYATGAWRDEPLYTQNAPLKCGKGSAYEGGIREPMLVCWPGVTDSAERCDTYVLAEDIFPTVLDLAGVRYKDAPQKIDGRSIVPLLKNPEKGSRGRRLYWNIPNIWDETGPGIGPSCTVRSGDWKLIYFYETGRKELYNITEDIGEDHDLSSERPEIVRKLSRELGRYLRRAGGQRPSFKATGQPCPWPDEI